MNAPRFAHELGHALLSSVVAAIALAAAGVVLAPFAALRVAIVVVAGVHVCRVIGGVRGAGGRLAVPTLWLAGAVALGVCTQSWAVFLCGQVLLLWMVRAWCRHAGARGALVDLLLLGLALLLAIASARYSHGFALTVWVFWFAHTLGHQVRWTAVTARGGDTPPGATRFENAWRQAEAARERLALREHVS